MSNNDTVEIPEAFENWISQWLMDNVISDVADFEMHNAKTTWARAIAIDAYRHLSSSTKPAIGLRWVKAIDGLPDLGSEHGPIFRNVATKEVYPEWVGGDHHTKILFFGKLGMPGNRDRIDIHFAECEWLDESIPSAEPAKESQPDAKKIAVDAIWKAIEHFQDARISDDACADRETWGDKVLSYNEVEKELYDVMELIANPSPPAPHPEPSEQSQGAFLEWLDGEIAGLAQREKNWESDYSQIMDRGAQWFAKKVREKYLSLHAQPKGGEKRQIPGKDFICEDLGDPECTKQCAACQAVQTIATQQPPSPPSVKPLSEIDTTVQAIRRHTEELIAQGPDACRKFLKDAGILNDEPSGDASLKPERGGERSNCGCTDGEQCDGTCYPQFDSIHIERAYCAGYINGAAANGSVIDGMADGKLKDAYIRFVKSDLVPGIISRSLTPEDLGQPSPTEQEGENQTFEEMAEADFEKWCDKEEDQFPLGSAEQYGFRLGAVASFKYRQSEVEDLTNMAAKLNKGWADSTKEIQSLQSQLSAKEKECERWKGDFDRTAKTLNNRVADLNAKIKEAQEYRKLVDELASGVCHITDELASVAQRLRNQYPQPKPSNNE